MNHKLELIFSAPKSFYASWRLTGFCQAFKFPVIVRYNTVFRSLTGKLESPNIGKEKAILYVGFDCGEGTADRKIRSVLQIDGTIRIEKKARFGVGTRICIEKDALWEMGSVINSSRFNIVCHKHIKIGHKLWAAWETSIMDTDLHPIRNVETGKLSNPHREVIIGDKSDLKEFYHLMTLTENRKDFISYNEDYYNTLYEVFNGNKSSKATLFLGKLIFDKTIDALEKNLKDIYNQISILPIDNLSKSAKAKLAELTKQKENITADIKKYKDYKEVYGDEIVLSAHMIIEYGDKAWVLYAGNHNVLSETYVNYNTYYEHLKYCKEKGIKIYDQFGTIGDLSKDNPRLGLHEFKKKFGGDYVEFTGEFDLVTNKLLYFVFTKLVPIYRKLVRNRSKKELKHEISKSK